jgi:predicted SAM-dependent methyltransferase
VRLHLGCGETYLRGYVNVDYPASEHPVMTAVRPDVEADLATLAYEPESVAEVRSHHVFEHFRRPTALRLLIDWYGWLEEGGLLVIETPDLERSARALLAGPASGRGVLVRHMFGSHEADWAVHCDGWYREKFERVLGALGYRELAFEDSEWLGTYNVTVRARKRRPFAAPADQAAAAEEILRESLLDPVAERRLLDVWLAELATGGARP